MQIVTISTQDLQAMLNSTIEPLKEELQQTKVLINLLNEKHEKSLEKFMTSNDLAEHFGVAVTTIRAWANRGKLPHYMIGQEMRFKFSEVTKVMKPIKTINK